MATTKIKWTDWTWNPVWGCQGGCEYCYARKIALRFGYDRVVKVYEGTCNTTDLMAKAKACENFMPTWFEDRFNAEFPKKAKRIFVNSMSDPAFWQREMIDKIVERINNYPDIEFQILTKFPQYSSIKSVKWPDNVVFGLTVTSHHAMLNARMDDFCKIRARKKFISFEPLRGLIDYSFFEQWAEFIDWVIVGCETGSGRKPTDNKHVRYIADYCKVYDIPCFVKQLEIEGKVCGDMELFPVNLRKREFINFKDL